MKDAAPGFSRHLPWVFSVVFAAAFLLRFVFICQWFTTPYGQTPYLDAHSYDLWARDILSGHWTKGRAFYQSPLFPYVLALVYGVFGHSFWIVALFDAILGAATCALLAVAGGRHFGTPAALMTGLLAAVYRPLIFYTAPVLKETLEVFLLALFLTSVLRALDKKREWDFLWSGIWLGFAALTRGNIAFLGLAVLPLVLVRWGKAGFKGCGFFILGALFTVLPVTFHNAWVSHDFVPITYADGFNFYVGNREGADGGNAYPAEVATGPGEEASTTQKAEAAAGHPLRPSEVSAYWLNRGIDFIALHPHQALMLLARKAALFFSDTEIPDNYNLDFCSRNMDTILHGPLPGFALVLGLVVFGLAAGEKERLRKSGPLLVLAGTYMLSVLPFYVTDRYRLPVLVFLLPLAGISAPVLRDLIQSRRWRRLAIAEAVAVVFIIGSLGFPRPTPTAEAIGWTGLSDIEFDLGRNNEGLDNLRKGIAVSAKDVGAYFYMKGVFAEDHLGHHDEALQLLKAGADLHPTEAASMYESYGRFLADRNDWPAALAAFQEAIRRSPDFVPAFSGVTRAWTKMGDRKHAIESAQQGLALDPANADLSRLLEGLKHGSR